MPSVDGQEKDLIDVTEGNVTDYSYIRHKIGELADKYEIKEIAYDRWNATQIVNDLVSDGMTMYPFGQGFASMSAPTKEFERLVKSRAIHHDANPVTRWMLGNIMLKRDPADNVKIDKGKSGDKVDGPVSIVMALGTYLQEAQKEKEQDFWFIDL
jgi:phage terminase large subunit-like protein